MPSQIDNDLSEYIEFVRNIWVAKCFANTYADELISAMYDAGFIIDSIYSSFSSSVYIHWYGKCYDDNMVNYKFTATWIFNTEKFTPMSDKHYFELTDLDIEPLGQ